MTTAFIPVIIQLPFGGNAIRNYYYRNGDGSGLKWSGLDRPGLNQNGVTPLFAVIGLVLAFTEYYTVKRHSKNDEKCPGKRKAG